MIMTSQHRSICHFQPWPLPILSAN